MTAQPFSKTQNEEEPLLESGEKMALPTELPEEIPASVSNPEENRTQDNLVKFSNEIRTLLAWKAPGRPFKKRKREFYLTGLLIAFLLVVLAFLFNQTILILVILSLAFLAIALATVPPRDFHYRISTEGITIEDHFFLWQELYDFYFKKRHGTDVLHIRTEAFFPGELTLTLGDISKEHAKAVLLPYLPFREVVRKTFVEKSGDWLAHNFPLEKAEKTKS